MSPTRAVDLIAKCRCGRTFTPMQWAELDTTNVLGGGYRKCPCGLNVKPEPLGSKIEE